MSVVADFRMTGGDLPVLKTLRAVTDVRVSLDKFVPFSSDVVPYIWVEGDHTAFEQSLRNDPKVGSVSKEAASGDRTLYHVEWGPHTRRTLQRLAQSELTLLAAAGDQSGWQYRARFPSRNEVSTYMDKCEESDLDVEITRLLSLPTYEEKMKQFGLSEKQREAVELAAKRGYFESPRNTSLTELASELGISQQAVSGRIRRGLQELVTHVMLELNTSDAR